MSFASRNFSVKWARLVCLVVCFALVLSSLPVHFRHDNANAQSSGLKRQFPPNYKLPNLNSLITEGKKSKQTDLPRPPLKPATICGYRDEACKRKKENEKKISQNFTPSNDNAAQATDDVALKSNNNWLGRLGRVFSNILPGLTSVSAKGNSSLASDLNRSAGNAAASGLSNSSVGAAPVMPPPPSFGTLVEAKLDPRYRVGGTGVDLFSGNYNFTLSLVSLPGRGGMNLNIPLSLNSLTWIKYGNTISYDYDYYPSLTPGFRTGFPEIEGPYFVNGANAYIVYLPSGRRVEMRQAATNRFEAIDSSYLYLEVDATDQTKMTLYSTDGTQCKFEIPITNAWSSRCTQIKDSNGNYITITYKNIGFLGFHLTVIHKVIDTLGREIVFNYDDQPGGTLHLMSITQDRTGQPPFYWAQFDYGVTHVTPNFGSLIVDGPNNVDIPVITRVITADRARHTFAYNSWGQVSTISSFGEADNPRTHTIYAFPGTSPAQSDCPRFSQRNDGIFAWPGQEGYYDETTGFGWGINYFYFDPNEALGQVTGPDGVTHKEIFGTSGGTRGLTTRTEAHHGGAIQQFTDITWASDSTSSPPLRPRMTETKICDDKNHTGGACEVGIDKLKKTTIEYTTVGGTIKLPWKVREYNEGGGSVYRSSRTEYLASANYINNNPGQIRRIVGLPSFTYLYEGDQSTLKAQTEYIYDNTETGFLQEHALSVRQHDTSTYGTGFQFRGNLTKARRYSVTSGVAGSFIETKTGYYITGNPAWTKDGENHETTILYEDSFLHYTQPTPETISYVTVPSDPPTYAYPTKVTVDETPADVTSTVSYNYDFGAITRAVDPKAYAAASGGNPQTMRVNTYDVNRRLEKALVWKDNLKHSQTRYIYGNDHNYVQTATTVNSLAEETAVLHLLDGIGRERIVINEHPGSQGGLSSFYRVFDKTGRVVEQSNPTEINGSWAFTGDDAAGYPFTRQDYDWKGRPTNFYHQDHTSQNPKKRTISYEGCGCAGSDITQFIDEMGRKRKAYRDVFGRTTKTEILKQNEDVYSSSVTAYDVRDLVTDMTEYAGPAGGAGASQQTLMTYDGHGRLRTSKRPQADGPTTFDYDNNDRVYHSKDARDAEGTLTYNARGLLTEATYITPGNVFPTSSVTFQYDANGMRTYMDDGPGGVTYQWDNLNRLTSETRTFDALPSQAFALSYEYNLVGQVTMLTDFDFDTVSYARDKVGRITAITGTPYGGVSNYASGIQYRAWGAPKAVSYGSGFNASANYTARMQVNAFNITGVIGGSYTYNSDGQLSTFVALYDAGMDRTFGYDELGRMNSSVAGTNGFKATFSPQQDEFGNVTSSTYHYWQNGSFPETFSATYQNNRATTVTDAGQTQTWNYDAMGNRTSMIKTVNGTPTAVEIIQVNARGNAAQSGQPDGDGRPVVMGGGGNFYVRSTVFGAEIVTELDNLGNKTGGRVLDGANLIATLGKASNTISWTHRDPLNLVAREVQQPGQVKRRTFAITPQGAQIETTDGVNLSQYYACLYGGNNNPGCTGYNPQAASAYGYLADQANGMLGSGIKVDGALTLRSVNDIMRQSERDGVGVVITGPTLSGTPLAFEGSGTFVRRGVLGWKEVAGMTTSKGKYERDYVRTVVDVWQFVPGGNELGSSLTFGLQQRREVVEPPSSLRRPYPCITMEDLLNDEDLQYTLNRAYELTSKSPRNERGGFVIWDQKSRNVVVHLSEVVGKTDRIGRKTWDIVHAENVARWNSPTGSDYRVMTYFHTHPPTDTTPPNPTVSHGDVSYLNSEGVPLGILVTGLGKWNVFNQSYQQVGDKPRKTVTPDDLKRCLPTYDAPKL